VIIIKSFGLILELSYSFLVVHGVTNLHNFLFYDWLGCFSLDFESFIVDWSVGQLAEEKPSVLLNFDQ
jgi:hypothetical protein